MRQPSLLIWMVIFLFLIFPTPVGKFLIDIAGGVLIIVTLIPIILGGIGWLTWKKIKSQLQTCEACGSSFLNTQLICPICGENTSIKDNQFDNIPASSATIDIKSENID
tara:strand:- start:256 stop:582 length:327 start_codon:yes stop_codon:yes gene_type:complete